MREHYELQFKCSENTTFKTDARQEEGKYNSNRLGIGTWQNFPCFSNGAHHNV